MEQQNYMFEGTDESLHSARRVIDKIWPFFQHAKSFLDLGCGMGGWSRGFEEKGIHKFKMIDHPSHPIEKLLVEHKQNFKGIDLDVQLLEKEQFDFAICIEVLEHFSEARALIIHESLCHTSDLILFSAAVPRQWGLGHKNNQWHHYWHNQFAKRGFSYFDGFKSGILADESIKYWLRQNLFIYYRDSQSHLFDGLQNVTSPDFLLLHTSIVEKPMGKKEWLRLFPKVLFKRKL